MFTIHRHRPDTEPCGNFMQTNIHPQFKNRQDVQEAESILRACVHCGFCTATCPTYQLLGDERDGPRGRIYLIKQMLESADVTEATQTHLDRCLTCRSCETTCPSGVRYGRLADIGRSIMEEKVPRTTGQKITRTLLRKALPNQTLISPLIKAGQIMRPLLPAALKAKVPAKQTSGLVPTTQHARTMLVLGGCVQKSATPSTNASATRVLDKLGITLKEVPEAGCCGAVSYHLSAHEEGIHAMRHNIDAWWPHIEAGAEAIVISASGCGAMVKEYGELMADDAIYAEKAAKVSEISKDLSEVLMHEDLGRLNIKTGTKTAVHCPCTLQHALKLGGVVEAILSKAGFELATTKDNHLCCGSAGTYSILQSDISQQLLSRKLDALTGDAPEQIVTANIGCQMHLGSKSTVPVKHWIELLDS